MGELVSQYLEGRLTESPYFMFLVAQVRCFGDPRCFAYDDVSTIRGGGKHSDARVYARNVMASVGHHAQFIRETNPRLILIGGSSAFHEFKKQVLPAISDWRGDVVRLRNASSEGHRTHAGISTRVWLERYSEFRSDLLDTERPDGVCLWHLTAPDAGSPFRMTRS